MAKALSNFFNGSARDSDGFFTGPLQGTKLLVLEGLCIAPMDSRWTLEQITADLKLAMRVSRASSGIISLSLGPDGQLTGNGPHKRSFLGAVPQELLARGISYYPYHGANMFDGALAVAAEYNQAMSRMDEAFADLDKIVKNTPHPPKP